MTLRTISRHLIVLLLAACAVAVATPPAAPVAEEISLAARHFLSSLTPEQRTSISFALLNDERFDWHYIPRARRGIPLKTMTPEQRQLALALLRVPLSQQGYEQARNIMLLDQVLYELRGRNPIRDPEAYFFTVFGQPSDSAPWGWRVEGHHLSLNFTHARDGALSATPFFFGANPATVPTGPHAGLRVLAAQEDKARRLLRLFSPAQRERVILSVTAPSDIITGTARKADPGPPQGLALGAMESEQAAALLELIEVYAHRLRPELAEAELNKIRQAGPDKIHFAWAGGSEPGQPHYYRIHGPTFLIEYDNTQDNANHIHTVWREFNGDFGEDLLREHYAGSSHHAHSSTVLTRSPADPD